MLVAEAIDMLPPRFREIIEDVAVVVMDEPTEEQLAELGGDPNDPPLGVYLGAPLTEPGISTIPFEPNTIVLFQNLIEDVCENEVDLAEEIRITLYHEIAHHFGIEDDDMPDSVR
jgi:predicted Zn-dependent protease with MMP-like domain